MGNSVLGFLACDSTWDQMKAVQYYRAYLPLRELHRQAPDFTATLLDQRMLEGRTDDELSGHDLYVTSRVYGPEGHQEFAEAVHQAGGKWVVDTDDDLTEDSRLLMGYGQSFIDVLGAADYATVSTRALAHHLAQYTKEPPVVLKNHIDVGWFTQMANQVKQVLPGIKVGLSGSRSHYLDWWFAVQGLERLANEYQDVTPVLHGFRPHYMECTLEDHPRSAYVEHVPYAIYPTALKQFDVVMCAVRLDDEFNDYRSNVKALEVMATGGVAVCSRQSEYVALAEAGAPILLVEEDSADGWFEAIRPLITDQVLRAELQSRGPAWVAKHGDMCNGGYEYWATAYRNFVD